MKYICNECEGVDPCNLDTGETLNQMPPERCVTDGLHCNWQLIDVGDPEETLP